MGNRFFSFSFLLLFPLLATGHFGSAAAVGSGGHVLQLAGEDGHGHGHGHGDGHGGHSSHMGASMNDEEEDLDMSSILAFFRLHDIKVGKRISVYFPRIDPKMAFNFLPKQQADSIPFSSTTLPKLLKLFSISPDSPQGQAMKETLWSCEEDPVPGEIPHCATSLESLLDFAHTILGPQLDMQKTSSNPSVLLQNYTVLKQPRQIMAPKFISCHTMSFPFTVYFCHYPGPHTEAFKLLLRGDNGDVVDALISCHFDTSHWDPEHVSFRILGVEPGTSEVCHFLPADHFMLFPKS